MENLHSENDKTYSSTGGVQAKDIVQKIKDLYHAKKANVEAEQELVPTKAALFGLDIRFR
jgi:hypothetical protein